ncbi:MAG: ABC transporter ATP-binding protein [Phycisphaerales bacterium]|nr:ABC transporter ATP-binding protein [Phycisphaerales bacterium]
MIEVRQLHKHYPMGEEVVRALNGVDLNIHRGEFVAITGASGSGKSTLMHLLGCLDRPTRGSYKLDGRDVSRLSDSALAETRNRKIGFVFQTFNLINRTSALDNVCVPMFYAREFNGRVAAMKALERVGLAPRAGHKPSELSGGERQRVAIARALVNDPVLLLADEPTGNLDSRTGEQIMELFHDLNRQGVTIALVTHEPDVAMQAQRVIQMRDGEIVYDRPTSELTREQTSTSHAKLTGAPGIMPTPPRAATALVASRFLKTAGAGPASAPDSGEANDGPAVPRGRLAVAGGATAALVFALLAWIGAGVAVVAYRSVSALTPAEWKANPPKPFSPNDLPAGMAGWFGLLVLGAGGVLLFGVLAMALSVAAKRKIRRSASPLVGEGRAVWAFRLGMLAILVPLGGLAYVRLASPG